MNISSNKKSVAFMAVCAAIFLVVLFIPEKKISQKIVSQNEIVGLIKEQKSIATTEVKIRKMGIYDSETQFKSLNPSSWKLGKRLCVVPVDVVIIYGIDLNKLKDNDIEFLSGDTVKITIPEPEIIDKSYNPTTNHDEIVTISTGLRDNIGESTIQEIKKLAFEDVLSQETELRNEISTEIKNNTELVLTSMLKQLNLTPVFQYK